MCQLGRQHAGQPHVCFVLAMPSIGHQRPPTALGTWTSGHVQLLITYVLNTPVYAQARVQHTGRV